jgi:hypothetical protein
MTRYRNRLLLLAGARIPVNGRHNERLTMLGWSFL